MSSIVNASLAPNILKRKSFHLFNDVERPLNQNELDGIEEFVTKVVPLDSSIKTKIQLVKNEETNAKRGNEYCLLFYSEIKDNYLSNIGYIGEQIDLYLVSQNIGSLWYGIGRPLKKEKDLTYVIMILLSKMKEASFREDVYSSKRKPLEEGWVGESLPFSNLLRFSPSACNSQPWRTVHRGNSLKVYRVQPIQRGIMPINKITFYNRIDMGIYLCILEELLLSNDLPVSRTLYVDEGIEEEKTLLAEYRL